MFKYLSQMKHFWDINSRYEELKRKYDVVLPPLSPEFPFVRNTENWGYNHLKVSEYVNTIFKYNVKYRKLFIITIDTGAISRSNYLKKGFVDLGGNFSDDPDKYDNHGHFSHVSSSIVGKHPDGNMGLLNHPLFPEDFYAWTGIKVLNRYGSGSFSGIASGLQQAYDIGKPYRDKGYAVLINLSLGGTGFHQPTNTILKQLEAEGFFVIAAAGNSGNKGVEYPGSDPHTIAVGAFDRNNNIASFSSIGEAVDMAGPGVSIWGADHTEKGTMIISGTSMATPHKLGALGLLLAGNPDIKNRAQLLKFAGEYITDLGSPGEDNSFGMGASVLHKYPVNKKVGEPEPPKPDPDPEPEPPKPDPPKKQTRRIQVVMDNTFVSPVYIGGWDNSIMVKYKLEPVVTTDLIAQTACKKLVDAAIQEMTNTGFYFSNPAVDINDVGYWIAYFFEWLMKDKYNLILKVKGIEIKDDYNNGVYRANPTDGPRPVWSADFVDVDTRKVLANGN